MQNIRSLLGAEVEPLKPRTQTNNSSGSKKQESTRRLSLDAVLQEFNDWRVNKEHAGAAIPDKLWNKVFDLATLYPPTVLCGLLGISKPQYKKQTALRVEKEDNNPAPKPNSPGLCQVKVTPQKSSYQAQSLPSAKTMVVELCRPDGKVMKIHTTQDSIDKIIQTFFSEIKV